MRKTILCCLLLLLLLPVCALADGLSITAPTEAIRPGKSCLLTFEAEAGPVDLILVNDAGDRLSVVVLDHTAREGMNQVWWNGTYNGVPAPAGAWRLLLTQGDQQAECPVTVGSMAPYLTAITASTTVVTPTQPLTVRYAAGCDGWVTAGVWVGNQWVSLGSQSVEAGDNSFTWDGAGFQDGTCRFTLLLMNSEGDASTEEQLPVTLVGFTPAATQAPDEEAAADDADDMPEEEGLLIDEFLEEVLPEDELPEEPALPFEDEAPVTAAVSAEILDQSQFTPSYGSPYAGTDSSVNFWTLPMDITDEEAVWAMLTAPITVVDSGSKCTEKTQVYLRALPDDNADRVGVVTCKTQGVHVLTSYDNGWSLVECYSSSFHDTKVEAWNTLVQGYIKTSWLKEVTPNQEMGFVIDKLTQRLYIFRKGQLYSTLLVSTGQANKRQPYNETRSGEFITATKVGEFASDNLRCAMAIRFNSGDLLHEVPHTVNGDGSKNYRSTENKLGTRASHGCIRVQRAKTPQGVNMTWIWNNVKNSSKIRLVIWEDWQGRQIPVPDDDLLLYYNPKGGDYYHSAETCYMAKGRTFEPFRYAELDTGSFAALKRCTYCTPALRVAEINEINAQYLPGGDHDPVMTSAREKYFTYLDSVATDLLR